MRTTIETFTDTLHIKPPFQLTIGPTQYVVNQPARLVNEREHLRSDDELGGFNSVYIAPSPFQGTVRLFIDDKLAVVAHYRHPGPVAASIAKNPDDTFTIDLNKELSEVIDIPSTPTAP